MTFQRSLSKILYNMYTEQENLRYASTEHKETPYEKKKLWKIPGLLCEHRKTEKSAVIYIQSLLNEYKVSK